MSLELFLSLVDHTFGIGNGSTCKSRRERICYAVVLGFSGIFRIGYPSSSGLVYPGTYSRILFPCYTH